MNPLLLGPIFEIGGKIIERLFPDPQKKAEAELELLKLTQSGDLQVVLKQLEINAAEAAHPSIFVAGWRPFVGWASGAGVAYEFVARPFLEWVATIQSVPAPPSLDVESLLYLLGILLGVAGLRTIEKVKKAAK